MTKERWGDDTGILQDELIEGRAYSRAALDF